MRKLLIILCTFLLLSFTILISIANAQPGKSLPQGIYNARDTNLLIGTPIVAKIDSPSSRVIIIVIDSNENIQELVRLGPQSSEHVLKPLEYGSTIIVFGNSSVTFS